MQRRDALLMLAASPLLSLPSSSSAVAAAKGFVDDARVAEYIARLHKEHAFSPVELQSFFSRLSYDNKVLKLAGATAEASEKKKPAKKVYWREYRKQRLTPRKTANGIAFHKKHRDALLSAEATYGVPAAVIVAILGVETNYGEFTGNYSVARTLATLGFGHPRRGEEFLDELTEFLLYAREIRVDPMSISGSYAGAIGMAQFMPSSLRRFAVDSDGDDRANLFSAEDAIASIGNFLAEHGWQGGVGISYPAQVAQKAAAKRLIALTSDNAYKAVMTHAEISELGVQTPAPADAARRYVFVDLENRYDTEYRVGTENFYALTRYNKSFKYAALVTDLATEIGKGVPAAKK